MTLATCGKPTPISKPTSTACERKSARETQLKYPRQKIGAISATIPASASRSAAPRVSGLDSTERRWPEAAAPQISLASRGSSLGWELTF
jgi:hypothetical protein